MADLNDKYIVFGAKTVCSMGLRESKLVLNNDHGIFIRGKAQLNTKDKIENDNIVPFGGCKSAANPDTAMKMAQKGISLSLPTFSSAFLMPPVNGLCAGKCTPIITQVEWEDGNEYTDIDDEKALMGRCTITCAYGGIIKITDAGQS